MHCQLVSAVLYPPAAPARPRGFPTWMGVHTSQYPPHDWVLHAHRHALFHAHLGARRVARPCRGTAHHAPAKVGAPVVAWAPVWKGPEAGPGVVGGEGRRPRALLVWAAHLLAAHGVRMQQGGLSRSQRMLVGLVLARGRRAGWQVALQLDDVACGYCRLFRLQTRTWYRCYVL